MRTRALQQDRGSAFARRLIGLVLASVMASTGCSSAVPRSAAPSATVLGATSTNGVRSAGPSPRPAPSQSVTVVQPPGLIAYDRMEGAFGAEGPYLGTYILRSDGTQERTLTVPIDVNVLTPVWSPNGSRLLLETWGAPGPARPAVIGADGSDFVRFELPDVGGDVGCSDWLPDGELLACWVVGFTPDLDGIYTLRPDGTGLTRLTTSPFHFTEGSAGQCGGGDGRPVPSPDGSQIAFIRQRCGTGANPSNDESAAIEVMNSDGTGLREIVPQGGVRSHPGSKLSWSPDGSTIAFGSQAGELLLVRPDGAGLTQIRMPANVGGHHAYGPDWSPDGSRLVFSMYLDSTSSTELFSIAPDGTEFARLTESDGAENFASWGPPAGP